MSESVAEPLDADSIKRILNCLDEFLQTDSTCVWPEPGIIGEAGKCGVDAEHFCLSLNRFILERGDSQAMMSQLARILEISGFVRSGGSRMMLYRLETGCRSVVSDYFQEISQKLNTALVTACRHSCKVDAPTGGVSESELGSAMSLIAQLRATDKDEEKLVGAAILEIDAFLIEVRRRLDAELKSEWAESVAR